MFDDINLFISLVDSGSFAKLAKKLGIHQSTISRRIEQLEASLPLKLIKNVLYGSIELTDEGHELYRSTTQKFMDINSAIEVIRAKNQQLHGDFKLIIPAFVHMLIGPVVNKFLQLYPDVNIHISNFNADVSTYESTFDVAISFIPPRNQNYIISVLHSISYSYYATPNYLEKHGTPLSLQDLENHQAIVPLLEQIPYLNWQARNLDSDKMETVTIKKLKAAYDGSIGGKFLTLAHQGVCSLPDMMVEEEVRENKLTRILTNYLVPEVKLFAIKSDNNFKAKNAAFIEFLKKAIPSIIAMHKK